MTGSATGCPDENALLRVALGASDEAELGTVQEHVDDCDSCRRALAAIARDSIAAPERGPATLKVGQRLGRYTVEELLGVGGMGVVYAGRDPALDRRVALKLLRNEEDELSVSRLRREAQTMARLSHPNVVPVFELGEWDGRLFLAMELVEGTTLEVWRRTGPSPQRVLEAFVEAGRGLAAAHAAGIVHRDFKPSNVLIGLDERARVTDFGLARPQLSPRSDGSSAVVDVETSQLTETGAVLGTPAYMSPEQLAGTPTDARSDQFSWCIALVEALTGTRPYEGRSAQELARAISRAPRLDGLPRALARRGSLRATLVRGLSVDPSARFESMEALLLALERPRSRLGWRLGAGALSVAAMGVAVALALAPSPAADSAAAAVAEGVEPAPLSNTLEVVVGASRRLWIPGVTKVAVGDSSCADVRVARPNVLELHGLRAGETAILVTSAGETRRWTVKVTDVRSASVHLVRGHQQVLEAKGLARVAVGDASIVDVKTTGKNEVLLIAQRVGTTTIILWDESGARKAYEVEVTGR